MKGSERIMPKMRNSWTRSTHRKMNCSRILTSSMQKLMTMSSACRNRHRRNPNPLSSSTSLVDIASKRHPATRWPTNSRNISGLLALLNHSRALILFAGGLRGERGSQTCIGLFATCFAFQVSHIFSKSSGCWIHIYYLRVCRRGRTDIFRWP
jgi:hypothetical protein